MIGVWSVANAATYVKRFLLANKADGVTYRFPDVSGAMAEVDSTLRTAAAVSVLLMMQDAWHRCWTFRIMS